jgi:CSLREA domain-containing protein
MKHLKTLLLTAVLAVTALGLMAAPAFAAPVINTTVDQSLGDCSVTCSLRDAVALASDGDTLHVPAGNYVLTLGQIVTGNNLTIVGDGARSTVIDGNGADRIFELGTDAFMPMTIEITDLSLINGLATTPDGSGNLYGGAIYGGGNVFPLTYGLTLRRCRIAGNQAEVAGGIFWAGDLTIDQCTISDNLATSSADVFGFSFGAGGIFTAGLLGDATITNSTLTGNTSLVGWGGGAIFLTPAYLTNVTVTGNQAPSGGGLFPLLAAYVANTIIADNPGGDCLIFGNFNSSDHNLDSDNSCALIGPGDLSGFAPLLGPLANNGGPTDTHALLAGSPALDAGGICPPTDQRGVARPQGPACDIGAFEAAATPEDQIAALIAEIEALVAGGDLAGNKANPLIGKLEQVLAKLEGEQTAAACGQLGAFINQVNAYISNGTLTAAEGQALIDAVNAVRADIGC